MKLLVTVVYNFIATSADLDEDASKTLLVEL